MTTKRHRDFSLHSLSEEKTVDTEVNKESTSSSPSPWHLFLKNASYEQIKLRWSQELSLILKPHSNLLESYSPLLIITPDGQDSISDFYSDRIYSALRENNKDKSKDVLLVIVSLGGSIEPAYQISKLCRSYSKNKFIVTIPRRAKSAATLIAVGGDQIHMGELGQLGPIDPQLRGLPALGVAQALERIATLSERHPGSSDMLARYLRMALTVEEIGFYERIIESAVQYAERLLLTKPTLSETAILIANRLVHEFKDHGFVIDFDEAQKILGKEWIIGDSLELKLAEDIYTLYEQVNLFLTLMKNKRLLLIGGLQTQPLIFENKNV